MVRGAAVGMCLRLGRVLVGHCHTAPRGGRAIGVAHEELVQVFVFGSHFSINPLHST